MDGGAAVEPDWMGELAGIHRGVQGFGFDARTGFRSPVARIVGEI
jgi:hypothetical protein